MVWALKIICEDIVIQYGNREYLGEQEDDKN